MGNFYHDCDDLQFVIKHMRWDKFVPLLESDFSESKDNEMAPTNLEEAVETYDMVLETIGDVCANMIAPDAAEVDKTGAKCVDGVVSYAPKSQKQLEKFKELGLMGLTIPRKYGGQNLPGTVYIAVNEMVARADAGMMTIFSLQGCSETINFFASEELKQKFLPGIASGDYSCAMALTEPNAGSDLGSIKTKATLVDEEKGLWHLNGSKCFITNGNADVILTLARSEEGSADARGLSLFITEAGPTLEIPRIEDKLGIHSSPTCVQNYNDTPGYLVGKRRRGLTTYIFQLMLGARLGIAIQAIGTAQAALQCAREYAEERKQFKTKLSDFPPVREMLLTDQVDLEAARILVYEVSTMIDMKTAMERKIGNDPDSKIELKPALRKLDKYCDTLTPICKYVACELVNRITFNAIQVHGGYGFTREYPVERFYRDARIFNIYEGTREMQVRATVPGILSGNINPYIEELREEITGDGVVAELKARVDASLDKLKEASLFVSELEDGQDYIILKGREITDMACDILQGYYLLRQAMVSDRKKLVAGKFIADAEHRINSNHARILGKEANALDNFASIMDEKNG